MDFSYVGDSTTDKWNPYYPLPPLPSWVNPYPFTQHQGWLCPRCGKSNAPRVRSCSCQPRPPIVTCSNEDAS